MPQGQEWTVNLALVHCKIVPSEAGSCKPGGWEMHIPGGILKLPRWRGIPGMGLPQVSALWAGFRARWKPLPSSS